MTIGLWSSGVGVGPYTVRRTRLFALSPQNGESRALGTPESPARSGYGR